MDDAKAPITNNEERITRLEARVTSIEAILNDPLKPEDISRKTGRKPVTFDDKKRLVFHVKLPTESRTEQQKAAILLAMKFLKDTEPNMTSYKLSEILHQSGIDVTRIDNSLRDLKKTSPKLIVSKPRQKSITLSPDGEEAANSLLTKLEWKGQT
jgi:hypothetical protein